MANSTISALTSATTPLAGTETLPVVQSGSTKQVSVANLTYGRDVSTRSILVRSDSGPTTYYGTISHDAVTTGANIYDVTSASGGGHVFRRGGSTLVSIDAGGNIIPAVAGKGVNFTANTPASGMTSQNLTWYEEGTWTPAKGSGLAVVGTFSSTGYYTRIGRQVTVIGTLTGSTSVAANAGAILTTNMPFVAGSAYSIGNASNASQTATYFVFNNPTTAYIYGGAAIVATTTIYFQMTYFV